VLREFVKQDKMIINENVKQVKSCQHHEEQEYENDDPIRDLSRDAIDHIQIIELCENSEKDKDSCNLSILKSVMCEIKSMLDFQMII